MVARAMFVVAIMQALLQGCASEPMVLRLASNTNADLVWPAPASGETPRYRWLGELTGDDNLTTASGKPPGALGKTLRWLVGLDADGRSRQLLQRPSAGLVDARGRIIVADVSRRVLFVFDQRQGRVETWEQADRDTRFIAPVAIVATDSGDILVSDAELKKIYRLRADGTPISAFGGGVLKRPTGIAFDHLQKRIYVADAYAHDIKVFDDQARLISSIGGRGEAAGEFNYPTHLAFADGRLYVTDSLNARVQVIDQQGQVVQSVGARGLYIGNLTRPKGIAVDASGRLYVVESFHDHLLVFDRNGAPLLGIGGTGKNAGQFYLPSAVWTDAENRVYVADMFNGRIAVLQFLGGE